MGFLDQLSRNVLVFDGAMGTMLQKAGLKPGEKPESLNFSHPEWVRRVHAAYLEAGADVLETNTFGANPIKLGQSPDTRETILKAVSITREAIAASGREAYVAVSVGSTGKLPEPYGDLPFEDAVSCFAVVMRAAEESGADAVIVETMSDLCESRAALLAARENTRLPVILSVTLDEKGRMLTGADVFAAATLAESFSCAAVGLNCGTGPREMLSQLPRLSTATRLPIIANPNAGLPRMEAGRTVFDVEPEEFSRDALLLIRAGAHLVGGCCGTTPAHIEAVKTKVGSQSPVPSGSQRRCRITTGSRWVEVDENTSVGFLSADDPEIRDALKDGDFESAADPAFDLEEDLICLYAGKTGSAFTVWACEVLSQCGRPLILECGDAAALRAAVRAYNGVPMVVADGADSIQTAIQYGCAVLIRKKGRNLLQMEAMADEIAAGIPPHRIVLETEEPSRYCTIRPF